MAKKKKSQMESSIPDDLIQQALNSVKAAEQKGDGEKVRSEEFSKRTGLEIWSLVSAGRIARILEGEPSLVARFGRDCIRAFVQYVSGRS